MPKYIVSLYYSGYLNIKVEAESEDAARNNAEIAAETMSPAQASTILGTLERWESADTITRQEQR